MDKYDKAIKYLTRHPKRIVEAWSAYPISEAHCLFQRCGDEGCGCLTQIKSSSDRTAATPKLTKAIRSDGRIPRDPTEITVKDLPVFAEWQRRLDKELGRNVKNE